MNRPSAWSTPCSRSRSRRWRRNWATPPMIRTAIPSPTPRGNFVYHGGQPLTALPLDTPVRIVHIEDEPETVYAQLVAEGFYPGMEVRLLEMSPTRVRFWANGDEHLLAPLMAANISVRPVEHGGCDPQRRTAGAGRDAGAAAAGPARPGGEPLAALPRGRTPPHDGSGHSARYGDHGRADQPQRRSHGLPHPRRYDRAAREQAQLINIQRTGGGGCMSKQFARKNGGENTLPVPVPANQHDTSPCWTTTHPLRSRSSRRRPATARPAAPPAPPTTQPNCSDWAST